MADEEDARTLWCGNLSERITHEILYELFMQAGPLENLRIPRDREGRPRNFAFVTYTHSESCPYAIELFRGTELFDRKISLKRQNSSSGNNINGHGPAAKILDPENERLRGRPLQNGYSVTEADQNFMNLTNQMITNGVPSNHPLFGSYEHHQSGGLSNASLQGQWTARHPPQWDDRRHDSYRPSRDQDRSRGNRDRSRSDRDREGEGGNRQDRHNQREDLRQRLDRFPRDEPRDPRNRNRGNNYNRNNTNYSRD